MRLVYIYILDAGERAKARSLLDPSDPSDAKARSPPISDFGPSISASGLPPSALSNPISDLGPPNSASGTQPSAFSFPKRAKL